MCCDRHLEIPGVSNNTTGTLEQKKTISGSLSNVYGYVLALVVTLLGISYLVVEDGIHQGVCNDL